MRVRLLYDNLLYGYDEHTFFNHEIPMKIDEFIKLNKPANQRSMFDPYINEIFRLKKAGYSLVQICQFLSENDIKTNKSSLSQYIKRRSNCLKEEQDRPMIQENNEPVQKTPGESKINTPADVRKARRHEINIDDYS